MSTTFVITGMHRSGTSMLAHIAHCAGIALGDTLIGPTKSNRFGHFEDVDFVNLHKEILVRDTGYSWLVTSRPKFTEADRERAAKLITQREHRAFWGWKDPRTSLFLPEWESLLSAPVFFFVWRRCAEVIDSCYRRNPLPAPPIMMFFRQAGNMKQRLRAVRQGHRRRRAYSAARHAESWLLHNECILDFIGTSRSRTFLFYVQDVAKKPALVTDTLCNITGAQLSHTDQATAVVEGSAIASGVPDDILPRAYRRQVHAMEKALQATSIRG